MILGGRESSSSSPSISIIFYIPFIFVAMSSDPAAKTKSGLSLYANLLDPSLASNSTPGTISRAPVVFKQSSGEDVKPEEPTTQKQQISAGRY